MNYNRFKSLNKIIKNDLREWQRSNAILKDFRYSWLQRILINLSDRSLSNTFKLFVLSLLVNTNILLWKNKLTSFALTLKLNTFSPEVVLNYFSTLWTIQATLAALVYPIVIGFISVLLQSRQSAKARLRIYLTDSAAVLTGLSSLFLVLSLAIQYMFIVKVHGGVLIGWILVDSTWFVCNCFGTIYFLYRTFEFLHPDIQNQIITKYAVNIAWPEQIKRSLKFNFFYGAQDYGILPGPIFGKDQIKKEPHILLHPLFSDYGSPVVTTNLKSPRRLVDVRFRILNWTINNWLKRARSQNSESELRLIFPLIPGETYKNEFALCRQEGGASLLWWEKKLIRYSFIFQGKGKSGFATIESIFEDIQSDILTKINNRNIQAFKEDLGLFIDLHVTLIKAGVFKNDLGEIDNYANLADPQDFFERSISHKWARFYIDIFSNCVSLLSDNSEYFEHAAYIPKRLFNDCRENNIKTVLEYFIKLPSFLFIRLGAWWAKIAEEKGEYIHDFCKPTVLNPPYYSKYQSALKTFVGAWESLGKSIFHLDRTKVYPWKELTFNGDLFETHLKQTLYMLCECVARGDKDAAEWIEDVLQKWLSEVSYPLHDFAYTVRRDKFISTGLFTKEWDNVKSTIQIEPYYYEKPNLTSAVFASALKNYWIDGCCLVIYLFSIWGKKCDCKQSLPFSLIKSIIEGREQKAGGGGIFKRKPFDSLDGAFTSLLRQHFADKSYRSRLDSMVENLQSVLRPEMVPGRIYSGWGSQDLDSIKDGQIFLLCVMAKSEWRPAEVLSDYVLQLASADDTVARNMTEFLKSIITRLGQEDFMEWKTAFLCVREIEMDNGEFSNAIEQIKKRIQELIDFITNLRSEQLKKAPISKNRLLEISRFASSLAFNKETTNLPITFFKRIKKSQAKVAERSITIKDSEKGQFTEPLLAQLVVNEKEWYAKTIKQYVAGFVMADILKMVNMLTVDGSTPDKYWNQLKSAANKLTSSGLKTILLVENATIPEWIWDWGWPESEDRFKRPDDLHVSRLESETIVTGYIGHFNDIAVYSAPIPHGASYVFALETFKEITFTEFNSGYLVDVSCESTQNFALVNLILKWGQSINLELHPVTRLEYHEVQKEEKD